MKAHKNIPDIEFYQKLGELFYAIAAVDKVVKDEEYKILETMVVNHFMVNTNKDMAMQIKNTFNLLYYKKMEAQSCFNNFQNYARKQASLFTKEKIKSILETANAIASAFASRNKSELIMLANLELLFKENKF